MIIVMKQDAGANAPGVEQVIALSKTFPGVRAQVHEVAGTHRSVVEVYLLGNTANVPTRPFEELEAVEQVVRVTDKFRAIGRHGNQRESVGFEYNGIKFSQDDLHVFAGLCAVDTQEHVELTFKALKEHGLQTTRAGAYKPRTSPYDFQGHGKACLPYLFELAGKYGIKVISMEVTHEIHIEEIMQALRATGGATGVMLQIGTRNAQNFELLKAVGNQTELPVLYKRGMGITLDESLNACEYIASGGNQHIVFGLRGVKSHLGDPHRNLVDFAHVPVVKRLTRLPVCVDPSHSVGSRVAGADGLLDVFQVTAQAVIAGANMVLVDFHPVPGQALCDGPQALKLHELGHFVEDVALVRRTYQERITLAKRAAASAAASAAAAAALTPNA